MRVHICSTLKDLISSSTCFCSRLYGIHFERLFKTVWTSFKLSKYVQNCLNMSKFIIATPLESRIWYTICSWSSPQSFLWGKQPIQSLCCSLFTDYLQNFSYDCMLRFYSLKNSWILGPWHCLFVFPVSWNTFWISYLLWS